MLKCFHPNFSKKIGLEHNLKVLRYYHNFVFHYVIFMLLKVVLSLNLSEDL